MIKHSPAGVMMTSLILEVFQINGLLLAEGDKLSKELGLTSARWQVMGALADGPLTASQIARKMGLKRQSIQRLVDVLSEQDILAFEENPYHRRAKLIHLTQAGHLLYKKMSTVQIEWINSIAKGFDEKNIEEAVALLRGFKLSLKPDTE